MNVENYNYLRALRKGVLDEEKRRLGEASESKVEEAQGRENELLLVLDELDHKIADLMTAIGTVIWGQGGFDYSVVDGLNRNGKVRAWKAHARVYSDYPIITDEYYELSLREPHDTRPSHLRDSYTPYDESNFRVVLESPAVTSTRSSKVAYERVFGLIAKSPNIQIWPFTKDGRVEHKNLAIGDFEGRLVVFQPFDSQTLQLIKESAVILGARKHEASSTLWQTPHGSGG